MDCFYFTFLFITLSEIFLFYFPFHYTVRNLSVLLSFSLNFYCLTFLQLAEISFLPSLFNTTSTMFSSYYLHFYDTDHLNVFPFTISQKTTLSDIFIFFFSLSLHCPTFLYFIPIIALSHILVYLFLSFFNYTVRQFSNFKISYLYHCQQILFFPLDIEPFTQSGAEQTLKKESTRKFAKMFMNFIWSQYIVQKLTSAVQDMSELDYCMAVHDRSE